MSKEPRHFFLFLARKNFNLKYAWVYLCLRNSTFSIIREVSLLTEWESVQSKKSCVLKMDPDQNKFILAQTFRPIRATLSKEQYFFHH